MWCIRKCIVYVYVTNGRIIPRCCYLIFSWSFCISVSLQWRVSPCSLMRLLQLLSISSTCCFEVLRSFRRPARRDTFSSRSFLRCRTKSIRVSEYLCISVSICVFLHFKYQLVSTDRAERSRTNKKKIPQLCQWAF